MCQVNYVDFCCCMHENKAGKVGLAEASSFQHI